MTFFRSFIYRPGCGASVLLALALGACTKEPNNPTYAAPSTTASLAGNAEAKEFAEYTQLKWSDDFTGGALDPSKWQYEVRDVWFNNELQATTKSPANLFLNSGNLIIQAQKEAYNGREYTSARIVTRDLQTFRYGRLDIRAKLPKGKGIWPAIWMLGANEATEPWPRCGEIDIMELRGSQPNVNLSTVHYGTGPTPPNKREKGTTISLDSGDFSQDFHTFSLVRSQDEMRFYLDGEQYFSLTPAQVSPYPFNNPFYLILNVAVGGIFDGDPDATTTFPQQMQVDYVKFYQY